MTTIPDPTCTCGHPRSQHAYVVVDGPCGASPDGCQKFSGTDLPRYTPDQARALIVDAASTLNITLIPWQIDAAAAMLTDCAFASARRSGNGAVRRVLEHIQGAS